MFGFVYEDCDIEKNIIEKYLSTNNSLSGLMILSGGCTMFEISKYFVSNFVSGLESNPNDLVVLESNVKYIDKPIGSFGSLTAVDFNYEQVNLVKNKINLLVHLPDKYNEYIDQINMPFDNLFVRIKNSESFDQVFSNSNLIDKFGESAVTNTSDSFTKHFENIYNDDTNKEQWNWIWNRNLKCKKINQKLMENIKYIKQTKIICGKFEDLLYTNTYDFIQTSNLTDWMDKSTFDLFCSK